MTLVPIYKSRQSLSYVVHPESQVPALRADDYGRNVLVGEGRDLHFTRLGGISEKSVYLGTTPVQSHAWPWYRFPTSTPPLAVPLPLPFPLLLPLPFTSTLRLPVPFAGLRTFRLFSLVGDLDNDNFTPSSSASRF